MSVRWRAENDKNGVSPEAFGSWKWFSTEALRTTLLGVSHAKHSSVALVDLGESGAAHTRRVLAAGNRTRNEPDAVPQSRVIG